MGVIADALKGAPTDPGGILVHVEEALPDDWDDLTEMDFFECNRFFEKFVDRYEIQLDDIYDLDDRVVEACEGDGTQKDQLILWCGRIRANTANLLGDAVVEHIDDLLDAVDKNIDSDKRRTAYGQAHLSEVEKDSLREHLDHIRGIIDRSPLSQRKKNALFDRIAQLQSEVDRSGTRTDAFFAFWGDVALVVGEMAENAKPALDEAKQILRIVVARRAEDEGLKLQSAKEFLSLTDGSEQKNGESG